MRLIRLLKYDLASEAAEWVKDGLIQEKQAVSICSRYGADYHQTTRKSWGYNVLIGLAFLFMGFSLIILLGANWDQIPRGLRMWGVICLAMGVQVFGLKKYMAGKINPAISLFFLGNLFYGASIILIAQIYHLGEHMPDGIFWWALGSLPIALLTISPWLCIMSTLLGLLWFLMEINMGFYPAFFPVFIASSILVLLRGKQNNLLLLLTTASVGFWIEYSLAHIWQGSGSLNFFPEHIFIGIAFFILIYAFSQLLSLKESTIAKDYGAILSLWSLRFGLILLLVMSFEDPWKELIEVDWENLMPMIAIVALFIGSALYLTFKSRAQWNVIIISVFLIISLLLVIISHDTSIAIPFQIISNIVLVGLGVWLIIRGINAGISHYFYLGIAAILLTALMRYVDLIGDYIGGALLFMFFAGILIGAAKYWKKTTDAGGDSMNKTALFIGVAIMLQFFILVGEYVSAETPLWFGDEVRIKTIPVDPRSMFRGNYARLRYSISGINAKEFPGDVDYRKGTIVYVLLEKGNDGLYDYSEISLSKPDNGVFIRGRLQNRQSNIESEFRINYGVEAFFAPKEKALRLEKDLSGGGIAILKINSNGKAALKDVIAGK